MIRIASPSRLSRILMIVLALALLVGCSLLPGVGASGPGMMGGRGMMGDRTSGAPGPGQTGFVAGTTATPRVVHIVAGPGEAFWPASVDVAPGETVMFEVTAVGPLTHEFKVGPAAVVRADGDAPEIADIGMMQTKSLTYTFDGPGPYAYACHEPGHYEAGMRGTITIVG
jgi:plastocyanin